MQSLKCMRSGVNYKYHDYLKEYTYLTPEGPKGIMMLPSHCELHEL